MKWYCEHLNGRHANLAADCAFRDRETSEGVALATNGGKVGAWYFDDEVDTRPTTFFAWQNVKAYACNCKCESECPVVIARRREIDEFVENVIAKGLWTALHISSELNNYVMMRSNGALYPRDIDLPREYADEASNILHERLSKEINDGRITNNKRQLA